MAIYDKIVKQLVIDARNFLALYAPTFNGKTPTTSASIEQNRNSTTATIANTTGVHRLV